MAQFSLRIKSVQSHPLSLPLLLSLLFLFSLFPLLPSFISMLLPSISHLIWNAIITLFPDNWIAYRCFSFFTFSPPNFLVFSNTNPPTQCTLQYQKNRGKSYMTNWPKIKENINKIMMEKVYEVDFLKNKND